MTIKALIFDLDGVLVDTMPLHFKAWEKLAEQHNRPFDQTMKDSFRGLPQRKCLAKLFAEQDLSSTDIQNLLQQKNDAYQAIIRNSEPDDLLTPGTLAFLSAAGDRGLKCGIASSSVSAEMVIQHTNLIDYVDAFAHGLTVNNGKPSTDIFVWVSGALGIPPRNCIVFEDGDVGLQAANKAGMWTTGIGTGEWLKQANWQFPAIEFIELDDLLQQAIVHDKEAIQET